MAIFTLPVCWFCSQWHWRTHDTEWNKAFLEARFSERLSSSPPPPPPTASSHLPPSLPRKPPTLWAVIPENTSLQMSSFTLSANPLPNSGLAIFGSIDIDIGESAPWILQQGSVRCQSQLLYAGRCYIPVHFCKDHHQIFKALKCQGPIFLYFTTADIWLPENCLWILFKHLTSSILLFLVFKSVNK